MTSRDSIRRKRKAIGFVCLFLIGIGVVIAARIRSVSLWRMSYELLFSLGVICIGVVPINFLLGYLRRGQTLLDCGSHPWRQTSLLLSAIFFVIGFSGLYQRGWTPNSELDSYPLLHLAMFLWGLHFTICGIGRLQLCEQGIWNFTHLVRWHDVQNWRLTNHKQLVIAPSYDPFQWIQCGTPIPVELQFNVEQLLTSRCTMQSGPSPTPPDT